MVALSKQLMLSRGSDLCLAAIVSIVSLVSIVPLLLGVKGHQGLHHASLAASVVRTALKGVFSLGLTRTPAFAAFLVEYRLDATACFLLDLPMLQAEVSLMHASTCRVSSPVPPACSQLPYLIMRRTAGGRHLHLSCLRHSPGSACTCVMA